MADEKDKQQKQEKQPKQPKGEKQQKKQKPPKEGQAAAEPKAEAAPAEPVEPAPRARLWDFYDQQVRGKLQQQFGFKNLHQIPRLKKIVLNVGMGDASKNPKGLDAAVAELAAITGQRPVVTRAKKAIATFSFDTGMSTRRCPAMQALRTRVSISATGSITLISCPPPYQLALRTPGISPRNASSRKQMRHNLNLRSVPRLRPQRWQR